MLKQEEIVSKQEDTNLEKVWSGIYNEINGVKKDIQGKVLTIIDAVIVDEKQNKNIKDLITSAIWNDQYLEFRIADWLNWYNEQSEKNSSSVPWNYLNSNGTPLLKNYKR